MNTTSLMDFAKMGAAVIALAAALFFGYSVVGYVAESFPSAFAVNDSGGGGSCGSCIVFWDGGGGGGGGGWGGGNTMLDGGGGGGGGFEPYCTLTLTQGPIQSASYPPIKQYILTWTAPYATSFSIDHSIGSVTPPTGGTYSFTTSATPGVYVGTAVTPYGTVTCQTPPLPVPPPTCTLTTSVSQCAPSDSVSLSWTTTNASAFSIAPGIGQVTPVSGGSTSVNPMTTTTYVGTVTGPGGTATCQTTVTVTPPPPAPPQCTLDLTKDSITWTTTGAFQVLISPLTNSPQIPGLTSGSAGVFPHTEGDAYVTAVFQNILANGGTSVPGPSVGFASDQTTMNKVCAVLHGAGSTASNIGARSYNSCSNNAVVKFNGSTWSTLPACSYNSHLSASFTCNTPAGLSTYPLNGSYNFVPPLGTGTHTYRLTANGTGGSVICEDTVTITPPPPPEECKLEITKVASVGTTTPGSQIEYTINFKNTGNKKCTGSGVKVQDTLDSRLTYVSETHSTNVTAGYGSDPVYKSSDRTLRFNAWDLDPAETGWVKVKATVGTPAQCSEVVPNKAKITSYEYNNFNTFVDSNVANVTVNKDCTPPPPEECKLEITKSANVSTSTPGSQVEYTIHVKNTGNKKCTGSGVKIYDVVDSMIAYQSETHSSNLTAGYGSDPVYKSSDRTLRFNAWDLDPNETGWIKWKGTFGTPSTCSVTVPNTAKVTSYEYNNFGTWVTSNTVNVALQKDCTPPPPQECKLEITKTVNDDSVAPNDTVEYTITVKNTGNKKCTGSGVKINDVLDSRLTYQSETHSSNLTAGYGSDPVYKSSDRTLRWNAWDLDPSETGWVKFVAKVGTPTSCTDTIPNKAKTTAYEYNNFGTWVESDTVSITVSKDCHVPVPYCTMSIDKSSIQNGESATLSWNTTNVSSASIDQGVGTVLLSGSQSVSPTANTTYTGTFTGPGGTVTCTASITVNTPTPTPQCTISVSASTITSGQSVMVSWTSTNVTQGFITQVGTTSPVSGGSSEVFPADSMTFTGTFTGSYGTATCSVPITVTRGGGGCSGNCGGGLNQPNVVMLQKPPEAPLAFVTLDQIPYTGFEAGKALTLAFWLAVGLLAAAVTYFVMGRGAMQYVMGNALTAAGIGRYDEYEDERDVMPRPVPSTLRAEERRDSAAYNGNGYAASVAQAPTYQNYQVAAPVAPAKPAVDGIPELADVIESRAHGAGVLMSPEALHAALQLSKDRGEALRMFGEILNDAVRVLPREDGWVMLTSERFEDLAGSTAKPVTLATPTSTPSVESILASVMPPAAPIVAAPNVEMPMTNADDQSVVMALTRAILAGNREQAYATLRNLEAGNANAATVMTVIAGACDQLYRARRHGLTTELSVPAMDISDEKLMKIVEVFTHGMDTAYSNPFTSLKLAVAQAFEARG